MKKTRDLRRSRTPIHFLCYGNDNNLNTILFLLFVYVFIYYTQVHNCSWYYDLFTPITLLSLLNLHYQPSDLLQKDSFSTKSPSDLHCFSLGILPTHRVRLSHSHFRDSNLPNSVQSPCRSSGHRNPVLYVPSHHPLLRSVYASSKFYIRVRQLPFVNFKEDYSLISFRNRLNVKTF